MEIVVNPRNEFVAELVGSNNLLRKLSLFTVQFLLQAKQSELSDNNSKVSPTSIQSHEDLRTALSLLLESGAEQLHVVDNKGKQLGVITFQDLHRLLFEQLTQTPEMSK